VRWTKRGRIIAAPPPNLGWARSHVALPIAMPLGGGAVRFFFSSRDERGRSQIGRAEIDLEVPARLRAVATTPVVTLGPLGAFDDSGVTTSCLVDHSGRQLLYYSGWTLGQTVPFYFYVGCAVSEDGGQTFRKVSPAPILERDEVDPYLTASPWVIVDGDMWRMWYVSGTGWVSISGAPRHSYHIKYAESRDGIHWKRSGIVCLDYANEREYAFGRPCVVKDGALYRMWYSYRGASYRIGYAESTDGLVWRRRDAEAGVEPSADGWDSEMIEYPAVFDMDGQRHMLFNGNGYGATGVGWAILDARTSTAS
jgi:hypothetical protein